MGCRCGGGASRPAETTLGYLVTYPDGSSTPEDAPLLSMMEARREVRQAGGGTIRRLVKPG